MRARVGMGVEWVHTKGEAVGPKRVEKPNSEQKSNREHVSEKSSMQCRQTERETERDRETDTHGRLCANIHTHTEVSSSCVFAMMVK